MTHENSSRSALRCFLAAGQVAAQDGPVLRLTDADDQIIQVQTKVRHTTVIVLPAQENILDFVLGDSEYWHLTGAGQPRFSQAHCRRG